MVLSCPDYLATRRFAGLDGLRAIAAVLVVGSHFGGTWWSGLNGWLGVQMFFVLSGYLITTLALLPAGVIMARMEPTRWGSVILGGAALVVPVLVIRLQQVYVYG